MSEEEKNEPVGPTEELQPTRSWIARIGRFIWFSFLGLIGLFLAAYLALQVPIVQNYVADRITKVLSKRLDTRVEIDHVRLAFFDRFILEGFYVEDLKGDSLLYADELMANFRTGPLALIRGRLGIDEIRLRHARLNVRRFQGDEYDTMGALLQNLSAGDSIALPDSSLAPPKRSAFYLDVRRILLEDVLFYREDSVNGGILSIYVGVGDCYFREFNLPEKRIIASSILIEEPQIEVRNYIPPPYKDFDDWLKSFEMEDDELVQSEEALDGQIDTSKFVVSFEQFDLLSGSFRLDNNRKEPVKSTPPDILSYNHLRVFDIGANFRDFSFNTDLEFTGRVNRLAFKEQSGFECENLSSEEVIVNSKTVQLNDFVLKTPASELGDTLVLTYREYPAFKEFPDRVRMEGHFDNAIVSIDDIMTFAPALENNGFFRENRQEKLTIDGLIEGRVNSLRGRDLNIRLADNVFIAGDFSTFNLAVPGLQSANLRLERMRTDIPTLRNLIPGFNVPSNFDKLGKLDFSGSFDGFFTDFVANGQMRSALGRADMDLRMNLYEGLEQARYSGELSLLNFDLGTWMGSPTVGKITFNSRVFDGYGLAANTANAKLEAKIDSFFFRNYQYENLQMNGQLNNQLFDGNFAIADENIDFHFAGTVDFTSNTPVFDFQAEVHKVDTRALNITEEDFVFSGDLNLQLENIDLAKAEGVVALRSFRIQHQQDSVYQIDSIIVRSSIDSLKKYLVVDSDLLTAQMEGRFNLDEIPEVFLQYAERNYADFAGKLGIQSTGAAIDTSTFSYEIRIADTKGLMGIVNPRFGEVKRAKIVGHFDGFQEELSLDAEFPAFDFGNIHLEDIIILANAVKDTSELDIAVFRTQIGKKLEFAPINVLGLVKRDTFDFGITAFNFTTVLNDLEVDGQVYMEDDHTVIRFDESDLVIWHSEWKIRENNRLAIGKDFFQTRDFVLTGKGAEANRRIVLESQGQKGMSFSLRNFDLRLIDEVWDYEQLNFDGAFSVEAYVGDLFEMKDLSLTVFADTLEVNTDDWGALRIDAQADDLKSPTDIFLSMTKPDQQLLVEGYYVLPNYEGAASVDSRKLAPNYFDFDLNISNYPLKIAEYWIGASVSNTVGKVDGALEIFGEPSGLNIDGQLDVRNAALTIDYLNTRYFIDGHTVQVDNEMFSADGAIIRDQLGNTATVTGGIAHDRLKNLGLNARIQSDNFLALNTRKGQNDMFYGTAIGEADITFNGPFNKVDIRVAATSRPGTKIFIPVTYEEEASEVNFIKFNTRQPQSNTGGFEVLVPEIQDAEGLDLRMDLNLTDVAQVEIIFDEKAGDILRGRGNGTLQMIVPRVGDFQMYGEYVVISGEYLFTLMNLVNKPFEVREGGTIRWAGDPFGAEIDLEAEYKGLKATLTNFLAEYLVTAEENEKQQARTPIDISLIMDLTGELLRPDINFDIQFPNLVGSLRTYVESKLRVLRQDQNEMNRQVFGLIVIGQFLPSNSNLQGSEFNVGINTLTEMLSQQLSLYLTGLVSEWLAEDGLISGIDFDIAYNYFQGTEILDGNTSTQAYTGNEVQVRLKNYLFDDRLSVNVGGNISVGGNNFFNADPANTSAGVFFAGNLAVEYALTKNRELKIRFYQSTEPEIGGGRRNQTGLGLSYRKEFDTFKEFLKGLRFSTRKMAKKENQ